MAIKKSGMNEALALVSSVVDRISDLSPVLTVVAQDFRSKVDDSFYDSKSPSGGNWEPLKPETVEKRRGGSAQPLVDTGRLRNSISTEVKPRSFSVGTNVDYAVFQQKGTKHIPARPFLPIDENNQPITDGAMSEVYDAAGDLIIKFILDGTL